MRGKVINRYTIGALAILLVAIAALVIFLPRYDSANAAKKPNHPSYTGTPQKTPGTPEFSFTSSESTNGWWQGATDKISMALFYKPNNCFVSIEHDKGVIKSDAKLQSHLDMLTQQGSTITKLSSKKLSLKTSSGSITYQLHQYHVTGGNAGGKLFGGEEFAYVPLSKGYLKVQGYCDTPDQLSATIPALQAITFKD